VKEERRRGQDAIAFSTTLSPNHTKISRKHGYNNRDGNIAALSCVKYRAKNLTPNPFPPLPSPLLQGEGKGIMFLAGRGVRIKASLLLLREVWREVRVYHIQSRRAIKTIAIKIIANS
jgi:hypothetical protein